MKKTTSDNFVFETVTHEKALQLFNSEELFTLHDDGSESLIETIEDLNHAIEKELSIGIEVGFLFI